MIENTINEFLAQFSDTPMAQTCASIQKKLEQRVGRQVFLELYEKSRSALESKRENNRAKKKEQVSVLQSNLNLLCFICFLN